MTNCWKKGLKEFLNIFQSESIWKPLSKSITDQDLDVICNEGFDDMFLNEYLFQLFALGKNHKLEVQRKTPRFHRNTELKRKV